MYYVYFIDENDISIFAINSRLPVENLIHFGKNIIFKVFFVAIKCINITFYFVTWLFISVDHINTLFSKPHEITIFFLITMKLCIFLYTTVYILKFWCNYIYFSADNVVTTNFKLPDENCINFGQNKICKFFLYLILCHMFQYNLLLVLILGSWVNVIYLFIKKK